MTPPVERLKRRREFLRVAGARNSAAMPGLVLQARSNADQEEAIRIGFTASRKVGNAVCRNRARRRLKAAVGLVMPDAAAVGHDYVVIARKGTIDRSFEALKRDLVKALKRLKCWNGAAADGAAPKVVSQGQ